MGASEWVAIGIFCASGILGTVGWLLIRVIGNLDKTIDKLNSNQDRQEDVLVSLQEKIVDNERRIMAIEIVHQMNGCVTDTRKVG